MRVRGPLFFCLRESQWHRGRHSLLKLSAIERVCPMNGQPLHKRKEKSRNSMDYEYAKITQLQSIEAFYGGVSK